MAVRVGTYINKLSDAIDRANYRVVYIALAVLIAAPFIVGHWEASPKPRKITKRLFNAIEECAETGKPVLLINAWRMSSRGENQPQFEVFVEHLMRRRIKFVMISLEPDTAIVGQRLCKRIERYYKDKNGEDWIQYGRDWLMLGYRAIYASGYWLIWIPNIKSSGMVKSFVRDYENKDLTTFPIMRRPGAPPLEKPGEPVDLDALSAEEYKEQWLRLDDFGLVLEVHFTHTIRDLIGLVRLDQDFRDADGKPKIKMGLGTVNMVVNEMLPYFDSDDLAGVLAGVQGASEYSELLRATEEGPSRETVRQRVNPYSLGILFVLFVIILGNLSTLWKRVAQGRGPSG